MQLVPGSVRNDAGFLPAAQALLAAHSSAIAVVDHDLRVVGLFTDDDLLRGLFPPYLGELHHTAFLVNEGKRCGPHEAAASEPVTRHMREAVTLDSTRVPRTSPSASSTCPGVRSRSSETAASSAWSASSSSPSCSWSSSTFPPKGAR